MFGFLSRFKTARRDASAGATPKPGDLNACLDGALNTMSQGLCMFDAQGRLLFWNRRYMQIYGLAHDAVAPGTLLHDLIALRASRGVYRSNPKQLADELIAGALAGKSSSVVTELADGRVISIRNTPNADGGWVSTHEDITEHRRTEERLREQKLQLDAALNNMSQGLLMFDRQTRLVFCNDRYLQMYGLTPDEARPGTMLIDLLELRRRFGNFPRDPTEYIEKLREQLAGGATVTFSTELPDGRVIQIDNRPLGDGRWVSSHEDITVARRAESRLRAQKVQLDAALNNMSQALCMFDSDTRIVLCNPSFAEMMGYSIEFLTGMPFLDMLKLRKANGVIPEEPEEIVSTVLNAMREGRTIVKIRERGNGRIHRVTDTPMATGGWITTIEDISEQRRAEQKLREQKLQLDTALNNMSQGLNMFGPDGRLMVLNDRYLQMYRLSPDGVKAGCSVRDLVQARIAAGTFFDIDPDKYVSDMLEAMKKGEPTSREKELTDGRIIAVHSRPTPEGAGWVVTHEDVTERRRAEKERDRSQAFASTVIENVPATIVVKDANTLRYVLVNRAGEAYFGAQRETMIGKTSDEIFPADTAAIIAEHDHTLLRTGEPQFYDEHPTMTPGAGARIVATTRTPIRDQQGELAYLLTVIEDRTNRKRAEAQIAHMAHHDVLTGLPNRAAFNACLAATVETAAKENGAFALMSLDVDRFKEINDVFGHVVGDDMLCELARRLQRHVGGAFVARLGGDEFTIIANDGEQPGAAESLANELLAAVGEEFHIDSHHLRIGISIGVAVFPTDGIDAATLIANADAALYRAKSEGRSIHRFFEAGMDKSLRDRRALQQDLQTAIERGELRLNYQPQARIGGGVFGFEALVRWRHPTRGMIPPGKFIPLAEESGQIIPMGEWILREACREAASWEKPLQVAINLSPVQFRHGDLPAMVHEVLIETGLQPGRLELEITEGVLIGDYSRALSILRRLKALGVRIAMDDFGTGYSSLSYLQSFPFDKIKIDRAFITNVETTPQSATIVRAVIGLARALSLPVLAEGVETREQAEFLAQEKCDEIQGYLIGKPLPIAEYSGLTGVATEPPPIRAAG